MDAANTAVARDSGDRAAEGGGTGTLTPAQFAEVEQAHVRSRKLRRAMAVAMVDAWVSALFAGLTILFAVISPWSLVIGAAFAVIACNSFRGARLLKHYDLRGPRVLAWNQAILAGVIVVYALYSLWRTATGSSELVTMLSGNASVASSFGDVRQLLWYLSIAVYGALIAGTVVTQGLTGWYYQSRGKVLAAYLRDTPPWVVELQKRQAGA